MAVDVASSGPIGRGGDAGALVADVARIVVVRGGGLGDVIYTLPALRALHETYPAAELTLVTSPWLATLLVGRPGPAGRVVALPDVRGVTVGPHEVGEPAAADAVVSALAATQPDLAVQLVGGGRYSNPFVRRLGARVAVGACDVDAHPLDRWVPYVFYQSEIARHLEVVALAGARTAVLEPELAVLDSDRAQAAAALDAAGVPGRAVPLVALCPGAGDPRRRWPPSSFAAVGDALAEAGGHVVLLGSAGDRALAEQVSAHMRAPVPNLAGAVSLTGLAGVLAGCALVVGNDSGPLHLAAAVGTATVGVYWCGNVITGGVLARARHRRAISWRLDCPVCGTDCTRGECAHSASFVAEVPIAEVAEPALELLAWPCPPA